MVDEPMQNPEDPESDDDSTPHDDGDLGFADDSWEPAARSDTNGPIAGLDREFLPVDRQNTEESTDSENENPESDDSTVTDTWVPDVGPAAESSQADSGHGGVDFDKTLPASGVPTTGGIDSGSSEPGASAEDGSSDESDVEKFDVDKTWVPSSSPTVDGVDSGSDETIGSRTWVPSGTPTVGGHEDPEIGGNAEGDENHDDTVEEVQQVDKTWVPVGARTHADPNVGRDTGDPNKTRVPSDTPTADGLNMPGKDDDLVAKTIVAGPPPGVVFDPEDSSTARTVEGLMDPGANQTIFSQTMGVRRPGNSDEDDWYEERSASDTAILDIPDDVDDSTMGRRTQIWSHQSGDGLSSALTIRNAPVSGESLFKDTLESDKPDYEIIRKLAEGGMGAVYVAKQTSLGRELAIKTLKPLRETDRKTYTAQGRISQVENQRREMFLSEALVTGNLVHPHIIPIHDLCQTGDGSPFYSMKRVHGTPWSEKIGEMSTDENLEVLLKVCDAIAYAHHNGVVNRDLKPENVMLGEFGEVLVLDWGLAVPARKSDKGKFASPAAPFGAGTPAYMSPELWTGPEEKIGVWSDIYLLGAILFEAVTGYTPHEFPEPDSGTGNTGLWMIIDKVVRRNTIRESEHAGELMDIATKAMSSSPRYRHRTVLEFQESIKDFQKHEDSRRLSGRASETLQAGEESHDGYQSYQTAVALFEEAHVAWPENTEASRGLRTARFKYASLAHSKGDYDLGLQIAAKEDDPGFDELTQKLQRSRGIRNGLKAATVIATILVLAVGTISYIQRNRIVALVGTKDTLEKQVDEAEGKLTEAQKKAREADGKVAAANLLVAEATKRLESSRSQLASTEKEAAEIAKELGSRTEDLRLAENKIRTADIKLQDASGRLSEADRKLNDAQKRITSSELELKDLQDQKRLLSEEKIRAGVDLQNARIASSIRNADYPAALKSVELLLASFATDLELKKLPNSEREERIRELKARRRQLKRRVSSNENPVQSQIVGRSGELLVQGDSSGNVFVFPVSSTLVRLPELPAESTNIGGPVTAVRMSEDGRLVVAATDKSLVFWIHGEPETQRVEAHDRKITTVRMRGGYLLTADQGGVIKGWDVATRQPLWSIRSTSSIRDVEILPKSRQFLYAGSRGKQSADILAYKLPPDSQPTARPARLGQLRLPRNRNNPPQRIAVSPDENYLLIGNSRNGELLSLSRINSDADAGGFPFEHASDLEQQGRTDWFASQHQRPINDIVFSEDGRRVVTASDDRSVGVWELTESNGFRPVQRLEGHGARVNAAGFLDPAGNYVISASADRSSRSWDVNKYRQEKRELEDIFDMEVIESGFRRKVHERRFGEALPGAGDISRSDVGRTEFRARQHLLTGYQSPEKEVTPASRPDHVVVNADSSAQRGAINSISLSDDGSRLVTGADDGTAVIWDTDTGVPLKGVSTRTADNAASVSFDEGHDFNVARLQFLPPGGSILLTTGFDGTLCLWDADTRKRHAGRQQLKIPGLGLVNAIAASRDGRLIATSEGGNDDRRSGAAVIWETQSLLSDGDARSVARMEGLHRAEVSAIAFNQMGSMLATGGRDGRVAVWDVATGRLLAAGQVHAKNTIVSHLEWVSGDQLFSAGFDGKLGLVDVQGITSSSAMEADGRPLALALDFVFVHDRVPVERVAFSPDRSQLVTVSVRTDRKTQKLDYELELWGVGRPESLGSIHPAIVQGKSPERIVAVNWSPDGKLLAAVVDDHLQILETTSWKILDVYDAPGLGISDAVFAPLGAGGSESSWIIATFDGTASHLWDLRDHSHLADFRPLFAVQSTSLVQVHDSRLLVTGDRAIRVFQAGENSRKFGQTLTKIGDPHGGVVTCIQFAPGDSGQDRQFVSAGADGSVALWNWDTAAQACEFIRWLKKNGAAVVSASWTADGSQILVAEQSGQLHLIPVTGDKAPLSFEVQSDFKLRIARARLSRDGRSVAVAGQYEASGESIAWIYRLHDDQPPRLHCTVENGHETGGIRDICFLPDSPYLVTGGADGAAIIWNWRPSRVGDGELTAYQAFQFLADDQPQAHSAAINCVAVSDNGKIATACEDGTAVIWKNPFAKQTPREPESSSSSRPEE